MLCDFVFLSMVPMHCSAITCDAFHSVHDGKVQPAGTGQKGAEVDASPHCCLISVTWNRLGYEIVTGSRLPS